MLRSSSAVESSVRLETHPLSLSQSMSCEYMESQPVASSCLPLFIVVRVFVQIGVLLGWTGIALREVSNNEKPSPP
jgi:hypothetical protein